MHYILRVQRHVVERDKGAEISLLIERGGNEYPREYVILRLSSSVRYPVLYNVQVEYEH